MIETIGGFFTGPVLVGLVAFVGIVLTIKTRFVQFRKLFSAIAGFFKSDSRKKDGISPFAAAATALSGTLGTGNIAGVGSAIAIGGAGALFWMWMSAFLSMATKYSEIALSVKYRRIGTDGQSYGGPMYYIKKATGSSFMAKLFAVLCCISAFFIGNMVQANTAASALRSMGSIPDAAVVIIMFVFTVTAGFIIFGGIKRISNIAKLLIPLLSLFYIVSCLIIIFKNSGLIGDAFLLIVKSAFKPQSMIGGAGGYFVMTAVKIGFSRGIFTNEAGLGSAPIVYASAKSDSPAKSGLFGVFEVFLDTIVICTLTGLVVIIYLLNGGAMLSDGSALTLAAFHSEIGSFAGIVIGISTMLFAFAAIIAWGGYGQSTLKYITKSHITMSVYKLLFTLCIFIGIFITSAKVWGLADILNSFMMLPNLLAILLLSNEVKQITCSLYPKSRQCKKQRKHE